MGESRVVGLLTGLTSAAGLVALLSLLPPIDARLDSLPGGFDALHASHLASVLAGLFLLFLAGQLRRQRRRAWQLSVTLLALATLAQIAKGPDWTELTATGVPLGLLVAARRRFRAPSDPPTLLRLLYFLPAWVFATTSFGLVSLWLERRYLAPPFSLGASLRTIAWGLVGQSGAYHYLHPRFERLFGDALLALGVAGAAAVLWLAFRPVFQRPSHTPEDWARARKLVETWGTDTLAYFALRRDKSFFYGSDGNGLIAYGYFAGYALASGDPIGPPDSVRLATAEFVAMCRERGWGIGFLAVREETLPLYEAHGLRGTYLGDEAILDCRRFGLEGPEMRPIRLPVNKLRKRGYRFELVEEDRTDPTTLRQLAALALRHHDEEHQHGFTMALDEPVTGTHPGLLLAIARNPAGVPEGFLRFVPCFGDDPGLSLDLMRREPDAPNGITEFLIANAALAARERGIGRLSLNFAAYGRLLESDVPLTLFERTMRALIVGTDPLFQTRSLWSFNRKFRPGWQPRALVYESTTTFPRVALSYVVAEGFVRIPGLGRLLVAQPPDQG